MVKNDIFGLTNDKDYNFLYGLLNELNPSVIVEVGAYLGKSAKFFADNTNSIVYSIDTFDESNVKNDPKIQTRFNEIPDINLTVENFLRLTDNKRIIPVQMESPNFISPITELENIDFVFLDARHIYEQVIKEIEFFWPRIKKNGYLTGHDYSIEHIGVISAIHEFFDKRNINVIVDNISTCWAVKK